VLSWEAPKLDLGDITPGTKIPLDLTLHNLGTTPTSLKLLAEGDGISIPNPSIDIKPGQSLAIPADWTPSGIGPASATIRTNSSNLPSLTFRANLQEPRILPPALKSASTPTPSPTATKNTNANPIHVLTKEENEERKKSTPSNVSYRLEKRWMSVDVIVSWKYNGPQPAKFSIEVEKLQRHDALSKPFEDRLKVPDELPEIKDTPTWCAVPAPIANIHQLPDGSWQGTAPGFKQGFHQIRIGAHPPASKKISYSAFVATIPKLPPFWVNKWLHGSLFLLCAACLLFRPLLRLLSRNK
jgi:hypothetical protein